MLPTLKQGRQAIWEGIDRDGRRMIDQAFPAWMRQPGTRGTNNSDMAIRFINGSVYQVVGSDNYDKLVGTNPVGLIMSEYAIADPAAWDYMRPILAENEGWAFFPYTPRGKNHGYRLAEMAKNNPNWFFSKLTVDDTYRDEDRQVYVIGPEVIEEERQSGMAEERILQEYYCDFNVGMEGSFYTNEIMLAETEGRIGSFPWDPNKPVQTWWDIGFRDATSVIFTQRNSAGNPNIIDYLEERNVALDQWVREVRSLPYTYEEPHWGPHDLENTDWATGKTRREVALELGFAFDIVPKLPVADGIDATRSIIRVANFNEDKCEKLIDGLRSYRREFDEKTKLFKDKPFHDWASHPADAMRYLSVGWNETVGSSIYSGKRFGVKGSVVRGSKPAQTAEEMYPWLVRGNIR